VGRSRQLRQHQRLLPAIGGRFLAGSVVAAAAAAAVAAAATAAAATAAAPLLGYLWRRRPAKALHFRRSPCRAPARALLYPPKAEAARKADLGEIGGVHHTGAIRLSVTGSS
jgi:hypothetical protein